jgi:hypothetical protein
VDVRALFTEAEAGSHREDQGKCLDDERPYTKVTVKDETTEDDLDFGYTTAGSGVIYHGWAQLSLLEPRFRADVALTVIILIVG